MKIIVLLSVLILSTFANAETSCDLLGEHRWSSYNSELVHQNYSQYSSSKCKLIADFAEALEGGVKKISKMHPFCADFAMPYHDRVQMLEHKWALKTAIEFFANKNDVEKVKRITVLTGAYERQFNDYFLKTKTYIDKCIGFYENKSDRTGSLDWSLNKEVYRNQINWLREGGAWDRDLVKTTVDVSYKSLGEILK